jgi:glyoxylase-like metal-dependent hydrolase (beta-lactamase superfamily II)
MPDLKAALIPVTPFQQNCTLLWDDATKRGSVIDPGGEAARIMAAVERLGLTVESILLTHGHLDHAGGSADLKRRLAAAGQDTPIIGPDHRDRFLLDGIAEQARGYGIPDMENATPDQWLVAGDEVNAGGVAFRVLHCPGHTPGHIVFVSRAQRLAIVGDVLFQGSVGRTDLPYGDHAALLRSIADNLLPLDDETTFLCGHGPGSTIGAERRSNPYLAGLTPGTNTQPAT